MHLGAHSQLATRRKTAVATALKNRLLTGRCARVQLREVKRLAQIKAGTLVAWIHESADLPQLPSRGAPCCHGAVRLYPCSDAAWSPGQIGQCCRRLPDQLPTTFLMCTSMKICRCSTRSSIKHIHPGSKYWSHHKLQHSTSLKRSTEKLAPLHFEISIAHFTMLRVFSQRAVTRVQYQRCFAEKTVVETVQEKAGAC